MPKQILTLRFGQRDFLIRPLTIGQLEDLGIGVARYADRQENQIDAERQNFAIMIEALAVALRRDCPDMTPDKVRDLEADSAELREAFRALLLHSGLVAEVPKSEPGENPAA